MDANVTFDASIEPKIEACTNASNHGISTLWSEWLTLRIREVPGSILGPDDRLS